AENTVVSEIWGLVIVNEHDNHDRQRLDSSLVYISAHNVYYVKYGGFALKFMSPSLSGTYR
ncbi:hypothetical protein, partial [Escherichia coli]|uniref:hypothetical protein n=1 Tax=Escherichia coli TaxID=562 RepID=UPI001BDBEE79